jgi:ssDNA-binding Zn-finger/Zn-ribbon topoisomerase 1
MEVLLLLAVVGGTLGYFASRARKIQPLSGPIELHSTSPTAPDGPPSMRAASSLPESSSILPTPPMPSSSGPSQTFRVSSTPSEFKRSTEGFIPTDRCEKCGGAWVKHVSKENGGRFFGCANYPRCRNTRDKQISDKQCSNGHRRTVYNTQYDAAGRRRCLECHPLGNSSTNHPQHRRPRARISQDRVGSTSPLMSNKEFCRNGHERRPSNTYCRPDGKRECRICRRDAR